LTQPEADLGMFSMFGRAGALWKGYRKFASHKCRTAARHFLVSGGLFMACCDI